MKIEKQVFYNLKMSQPEASNLEMLLQHIESNQQVFLICRLCSFNSRSNSLPHCLHFNFILDIFVLLCYKYKISLYDGNWINCGRDFEIASSTKHHCSIPLFIMGAELDSTEFLKETGQCDR